MKFILVNCCFLYMGIGSLIATEYEQYLQAHNAYAQKDYQKSISLLNQLPKNNFSVLYNLGWSYLRNNELYLAIKSFKTATFLATGIDRMRAYDLCKKIQQDLGVPVDTGFYTYWHYIFNAHCPILLVQLLFLMFLLVLCFVVCVMDFVNKKLLLTTLIIVTFITGVLAYDCYCAENMITILIKNNEGCLHTGPDFWYASLCTIQQGSDAYVISQSGEWYCVSCNKQTGWINAAHVDVVP